MPGRQAPAVHVTARQEELLRKLVRGTTTPQRLAVRAQIVLLAAAGHSSDSYALPDQHTTPYPLRLYAKTSFLAQSNRTVVQHLGPPTSPPRQFRVCETSQRPHSRLHQVLQQNHGQAIQVDLPGPTVDHLNQKRICADEHYTLWISGGRAEPPRTPSPCRTRRRRR